MAPNPNLFFFYGDKCSYSKQAQAEVECLEKHLGHKLNHVNVGASEENFNLYHTAAAGKCRGVPYFLNADEGFYICGVTDCENLKKWAAATNETE